MQLLIATCNVMYSGRLDAYLPSAKRLITIKADGCISVHADGGAYKPLNWMVAPNVLTEEIDEEGNRVLVVVNAKDETLAITLEEIFFEQTFDLGEDPGLVKDGVEMHLQELLAEQPERFGKGVTLMQREFPTDIGPIDLLLANPEGGTIAVEIKRRAEIDGVEQLTRYLERMNRDEMLTPIKGVLAAQVIKPQAKVLAESRGIDCLYVDYDELRGIESNQGRLFEPNGLW